MSATVDGAEALSKISGLSKPTINALWEEVKANHAKLDACKRHAFVALGERALNDKHKCTECGGTVNAIARGWYERGLAHAIANPLPTVMP